MGMQGKSGMPSGKKPARRWISGKAKYRIGQARQWNAASWLHRQDAEQLAKDAVEKQRTRISEVNALRSAVTPAKAISVAARNMNAEMRRDISKVSDSLHLSRKAKENARNRIGSAKRVVENRNPSPAARRGRRYREDIY